MRRKKELLAGLSRRLDIPREAFPFGFGLSLSGQETLKVHGCCRILTYGEDRICLSLGKRVLAIEGKGLLCTAFEAGSVTVEGYVCTLSFEEKEGEHET